MKRLLIIAVGLIASAVVLVTGSAAGGDGGKYQVRAIFDNGGFLVKGEEVRIAGANVGTIDEVTVTGEDEAAHVDGAPDPGKAVVVLNIDDAGFQDFRTDASCLIRPQSLLGEKYVECEPTQPRAAGSEAPPELSTIEDGQPGAGQHFLGLEANGKAVDLDLVNNIMREPYADRFRLILNDLGAGLAARGDELAEIVDRSDPALRETNRVLAILAEQNQELADLARNGNQSLAPLAREREHIGSFINSATETAQATADHSADLERNLQLLPETLRQVRSTMTELKGFSDAGSPLFTELGAAAPAATRATKALGPFADSAETALTSLGDAAQASQGPLVSSDPLIRQIRKLANSAAPATSNLSRFLRSLDRHGGFKSLLEFAFRAAGTFNGFDNIGHYTRAFLLITNCNDYVTAPQTGCIANFLQTTPTAKDDAHHRANRRHDNHPRRDGGLAPGEGGNGQGGDQGGIQSGELEPPTGPDETTTTTQPPIGIEPGTTTTTPTTTPDASTTTTTPDAGAAPGATTNTQRMRDVRGLLDFLIGSPQRAHKHGGKR
jgi:ABC-type transporter Mla subunit MlaD